MKNRSCRAAFTLIEIIMVIVILGVVAMIGTDIIAKMYQGYMRSQIISELQQKTELALDQISKRLKYRIKASVVTKDANNTATFKSLSSDDNGTYNMIEWIGYDNEGFLGEFNATAGSFMPGWSGFIDLHAVQTDENQTSTKGSTLAYARRTIMALSYGDIDLAATGAGDQYPAMIFKKHFFGASPRTFGFDPGSTDHNDTYPVRNIGNNLLEFTEDIQDKMLSEQYYLAWSAYALVPDIADDDDNFDLRLYYNYQPWHGERFDDNNPDIENSLIAENVSTFRFTQTGNTIRIKLCIQDENKTGTPIGFCKEKAVF